jgi:hypothetical protein
MYQYVLERTYILVRTGMYTYVLVARIYVYATTN